MNNSAGDTPRRVAPPVSGWVGYAVAVAAVAVATLVRLALDPALGDNYPFVTYFVAVAVVAWFGRTPTAVATLVASGGLTFYLFVPPRYSFAPTDPGVVRGLFLFLAVAGVIVAMSHSMRAARSRAERLLAEAVVRQDELRRSVAAEAEQRERLRTTLASIGDGVISTDRDGTVTYLNAVAESLTGWTHADAVGRPLTRVFRIVNENTRQPVENPALRALQEGVVVGLANHTVLIARDGTERPIDDSAAPIRCTDGEVVGCVLVFRDISERKRLEGERQEARERVAATLESITDAFTRFDREWRIVYVNAEAERLTGRHRSELLGRNHWDVFPTTVGTPLEAEYRRAVGERVTVEFEHYFPPLGRWFAVKGDPTPDGGLTVFFRDITGQKVQQEALAASEARFRELAAASERQRRLYETVLTNTPDFVYVFSLDHKVLYANDALIKMWGRGHDGAIGKTFLEIGYEPWHAAMHDREIDQVRATREPIRGEAPFTGTNGRRMYEYIFVPVLGADGGVEAVAGTTRDVTDRKEAEERQAFLVALADTLRPLSDPVDVQAEASRVLGEWLGVNRAAYFEVRGDEYVVARDYTDAVPSVVGRHPVAAFGPDLLAAYRAGRTATEADVAALASRTPEEKEAFAASQIRAYVGVPLVKDGVLVAGLAVHAVRERAWTQAEIALVEETAERTWAAVERVRAEAALRRSEERRRLALDAAELGVWQIDLATGAFTTDDRFRVIFAGTAGPMDYERAVAAVHPDDRGRVRAAVAAATRPDAPAPYAEEYRVVHPDGSVRWVSAKGRANRDRAGTGRLVSFDGTVADITARKCAEAALRESEERSAFVRRSTGVGFWYCDLPFDVLRWDELVKAHFHLPPDAAVTIRTFYDRLHPDDREPTRRAIEASIAGRTPYDIDYRTVAPDTGAVKWVRAIGRTFYAADGTPTRFDGVTLDVTDRKRAEQALRDSETYFRSMADTSPSMLWVTDLTGQCTYISRQWCEYTGTSLEQNLGLGWLDCVHPDDRPRAGDVFRESNRQGRSFAFDYRLRRHDGEYRWAVDAGQPRFDGTGRLIGYIGTVSDIHDRKRAEEELRNADRRKDEFLATLAHELRNPLAPIRNGLQVIRMAGASGTIEQARAMMERQLGQMVRLVDDLLDVSRVTTGKLTLSTARLELRAVIDAALETTRPVVEQAGHELVVTVPDEPIVVDGDLTRLAQVVSNLLTNSAKYTHRGGHVRLLVGRENGTAVVAVRDDGVGIPPAMLDRVFEMFVQVDRTLEKTTGGLGIGLSLVKGLVEMHGGTIAARSEGEGKGSEFVVRLPVASATPARSDRSDTTGEEVVPPGPRRILVVDDNADAADSLGQLLELLGNEVRTAYDGEAGVAAAGVFRPAVVLCDIGMPKLNGYDAARRIRAEPWGTNMVLVALTGWGQDDDRKRTADAGFDHHLVKPVDAAALMKLLAALN